jgi:hypothetical protein
LPHGPGTQSRPDGQQLSAGYRHALATGFARAFVVTSAIALLNLAITIVAIRFRRADLNGAEQPSAPWFPGQAPRSAADAA